MSPTTGGGRRAYRKDDPLAHMGIHELDGRADIRRSRRRIPPFCRQHSAIDCRPRVRHAGASSRRKRSISSSVLS